MVPAAMNSTEPITATNGEQSAQAQILSPMTSRNLSWIRTSPLVTAVCSTTIMGAALAVPLATMSAPDELRGVVLSMSLGVFSTVMAVAAGAALTSQRRPG